MIKMKRLAYIILVNMLLLCSCSHNNKLWRIQENGLYGFIDSIGNVVIEPQYRYVGNFYKGYACVVSSMALAKDSTLQIKYGYINTDNELVIDTTNTISIGATYKSGLSDFADKFADKLFGFEDFALMNLNLLDDRFVFQDPKTKYFGYKDSEGNVVIKPKYFLAHSFFYGKAVVNIVDLKDFEKKSMASLINRNGVIDINGNMIIKPEYAYISDFGKCGKTWASYISKDDDSYSKEWVLLDEKGKNVLPPMGGEHIYNSNDSLYIVEIDMLIPSYTFMDSKGKFLSDYDHNGRLSVSFQRGGESELFQDVTAFSEGFAGIKGQYEGHSAWFFANKKLDSNFIPYDSVQCFSEGLAAVKEYISDNDFPEDRPGKWGYIDRHARLQIPYQFSECGSFNGELAYFKNYGSTYNMEGYINRKGKIIWQTRCNK